MTPLTKVKSDIFRVTRGLLRLISKHFGCPSLLESIPNYLLDLLLRGKLRKFGRGIHLGACPSQKADRRRKASSASPRMYMRRGSLGSRNPYYELRVYIS